jgi:hypothetical protein
MLGLLTVDSYVRVWWPIGPRVNATFGDVQHNDVFGAEGSGTQER